jgi:hypothetical protein
MKKCMHNKEPENCPQCLAETLIDFIKPTHNGAAPEPQSDQWTECKTKYLPGDFVETEYGPAVIREAKQNAGIDKYAVWPLPEWRWKKEPWGWSPVKHAWYSQDELKLIEEGHASKLRPNARDKSQAERS